jgi:hypothetical protein
VELHKDQIVLGTEIGVFISSDLQGSGWAVLGDGLPTVPVSTIRNHPGDPWTMVVATFGRGVYTYEFPGRPDPKPQAKAKPGSGGGSGDEVLGTREARGETTAAGAGEEVQGGSLAATGARILILLLISAGCMAAGTLMVKLKERLGGWNP